MQLRSMAPHMAQITRIEWRPFGMGSGIEPNFSDAHHVGMVKGVGRESAMAMGRSDADQEEPDGEVG